jgi:hypothetical protein
MSGGVLGATRTTADTNSPNDINLVAKEQNKRNVAICLKEDATVDTEIAGLVAGNIGDVANLTIKQVRVRTTTAPAGADLIYDVNINGTTIFTTQSNRPTITDGSTGGVSGTPDITTFGTGALISVDCDQIGSGTAGGTNQYITIELE